MSCEIHAVAGKLLGIGPQTARKCTDYVPADFEGIEYTNVDGWKTVGALGDQLNVITGSLVNSARDYAIPGTFTPQAMENLFTNLSNDEGQLQCKSAFGRRKSRKWQVTGTDGGLASARTCTISNASPGVVTLASHGFANGTKVQFETSGELPAPLQPDTDYYVVDQASGNFKVAASSGGSPINTTTAGSGTHLVSKVLAPSYMYFVGFVSAFNYPGGEANTSDDVSITIQVQSNIVTVPAETE